MHPLQQHYVGGSDAALCAFGLEKVAVVASGKLTGMERIMAERKLNPLPGQTAGKSPLPLPAAPAAPMQLEQGFGGGPGAAPGFGGGGLPLDMPTSRSQESLKPGGGALRAGLLPKSVTGAGSIPGQAAIAERAATAVPTRFNLPNKLASFMTQ